MKKNLIRSLVLGLMVTLVTTAAVGCTNKKETNNPNPNTSNEPDTSKFVKLKMYNFGTPAKNEAEGVEQINKILKEKINANIELASISWGEWSQKTPVLLASGEPFDLIFSANWAFFTTEGPKGAYYPLNDLLPKYAPTVWKETPKEAWEQATINGKIYMMPQVTPNFQTHGIMVRDELRQKYNVPEIKTVDDFGLYLDAIKKNEPNLVPFNSQPNHLMNQLMYYTLDWSGPLTGAVGEIAYNLNSPEKAFIVAETPEYEAFVKRQREWYQKGYWSKDILSNKTQATEHFRNEQSAATVVNLSNANSTYEFVKNKNLPWDLKFYSIEGSSKIERAPYLANGMSVYRSSPNPERALMFVELLHTDRELFDATFYGVKGKNYDLTADGKVKAPEGVNPADAAWSNFGMGLMPWKFTRPSASKWEVISKIEEDYDKIAVASKLGGFVLNTEAVSAELAAVNNVCATYKTPLDWGVVDPEKGLPELRQKLKEAGIDKLLAEINKQIAAYLSK
jgi:putative aldouronate transport system substrate-binding protein